MKHLAGLTRIKYVFYYPETQDIVLAGPAEGWAESAAGRVVGMDTGHPVLELQDLIVALRAISPGEKSNPLVHCSIDATPEGLQRMQQFLSRVGRQIQPGDERYIVEGLRESLGHQMITLGGISTKTHFAQVMVEADYRMKLIGIGFRTGTGTNPQLFVVSQLCFDCSQRDCAAGGLYPDYQRIKDVRRRERGRVCRQRRQASRRGRAGHARWQPGFFGNPKPGESEVYPKLYSKICPSGRKTLPFMASYATVSTCSSQRPSCSNTICTAKPTGISRC